MGLIQNALTSWKTSTLGSALGIAVIYRGIDAHDWLYVVAGIAISLFGLVSRDADKNSEQHGVDELTKRIGPMVLIALCVLPISAHAFADVKPQIEKDSIAHFDPHALEAMICHNGEIHPGAVQMSVRGEKDMVTIHSTISTAEGTIKAPVSVTTAPKTIDVNAPVTVHEKAINIEAPMNVRLMDEKSAEIFATAFIKMAEVLSTNLSRPIQDLNNNAMNAAQKAETYALYFAGAMGLLAAVGIVGWIVTHRHKNEWKAVATKGAGR
jgi:hypothetical protein